MNIRTISTPLAPAPGGHYSQGVAFGDLLFVSGQLPSERGGDFETQCRLALQSVFAILQAAGTGPTRVLKVTAYIVGVENWPAFNRVFAEMFGETRPARAVVPVPELHHGCLVEIEATAALG